MDARLTRSVEICDAAPAQLRVVGIGADVGAIMPAALALRMRARMDLDADIIERRGHRIARLVFYQVRLRSDEDKAQIVRERAQEIMVFPVSIELHFAGKR